MGEWWPFVGRASETARLDASIAAGVGVLVLGEPGVGKTALVREVADRVGRTAPVIRVVGHAVSSGAPFEAFAAFLTTADTALLGPVEVARRVSDNLVRPSGTRALLVVDDAQLLDNRSAQVLLQLAADGVVTVLATAHDLDLPDGVQRWWRDGWCDRMELAGLSEIEVDELIETALGAPVDPAATRAFVGRSKGNPLVLRELIGAARASATLVIRDSAWTLLGPPPISSGIRDLVRSRLAVLPGPQRSALETVAAGEPLAMSIAADLIDESVLDRLDADRLITVHTGLVGPLVSTVHPLHGEVLRADMPRLRLQRLRLSLAGKLEASEHPSPHDLIRAALWRLEAGQADDPDRLVMAARAAICLSLDTAELLARRAHAVSGSLQSILLLAEILTLTGRTAEAESLTDGLPPDSLTTPDREALVYCEAMGRGLMTGDTALAADLVAAMMIGDPAAGDQVRGLYASLLAFDGRSTQALKAAGTLAEDPAVNPVARTFAAMGAVAAEYWLGHTRRAVALADALVPVATTVREAVPFGAASIELLAIDALIDEGLFDAAEQRARRMRAQAARDDDPFSGPRGECCLARVDLARGRPATALRKFRRCLSALTPFDRTFVRYISSMAARAAVTLGDLPAAEKILASCADAPRLRAYEPAFELSIAARLAAELRMGPAADHAAWAAGLAADHEQWNCALAGYHDAARYGAARAVLAPLRQAAGHVDGTLAWCHIDHAGALAARSPEALDEVARRFEAHGAILQAAEASAEAALAHTAADHRRPARASAARAARLRARSEDAMAPWLAGAAVAVPLTPRERQIAVLAGRGLSDAAIAEHLGISDRTVGTHLARVYAKLGLTGRHQITRHLVE